MGILLSGARLLLGRYAVKGGDINSSQHVSSEEASPQKAHNVSGNKNPKQMC